MRPLIKKGTTYKATWDNKESEIMAESDRITMPLGTYIKLVEEAGECASTPK